MDEITPNNKCLYCNYFRRHYVITDTGLKFTKDNNGDCTLYSKVVNTDDHMCKEFTPLHVEEFDSLIWKLRFAAKDIGLIVWHLKELLRLQITARKLKK